MLKKDDILKKLYFARDFILQSFSDIPETALILGTGLKDFSDKIEIISYIPFSEIPFYPRSSLKDHSGSLALASIYGKRFLMFGGRIHYYEGFSMDDVVFPIRLLKLLGVKNVILTNAAGAINESYSVGGLMLICDHIKFFNDSPLRGENISSFGPRFNDMTDCYTKSLRELAKKVAKDKNVDLKEGVYSFMPGPSFETPAEIKMLKALGADAVGMSTVPEAICACHSKINVIGISFLCNMAAGIGDGTALIDFSDDGKKDLEKILLGIIDSI